MVDVLVVMKGKTLFESVNLILKDEFHNIANKFKDVIANYNLFNTDNKIRIECFASENFPHGDNRIIDDLPINTSLLQLLLLVILRSISYLKFFLG